MVGVVSPTWLTDRLDDVHVVDVHDGWEFDGIGHLPGAVSIPFDEFRSADGDVGILPGRDAWTGLLSGAGAAADDDVVAYDDTYGVFVARFLVAAFLYDHDLDRLHLPGDDFSAWNRERETATEMSEVAGTVYETTESAKTPPVDFEAVEAVLDDPETIIVDTRDPAEYDEGHLPGVVNLDWREFVDDETRGLRPRDEFDAILDAVGVTSGRRVVLYCNAARRISHTYVALSHLGYSDMAFYEGSLTEWEEHDGAVVEGRRTRLRLTRVNRVVRGLAALVVVTTYVVDA